MGKNSIRSDYAISKICVECTHDVSKEAKAYPNCGKGNLGYSNLEKLIYFAIGIGLLLWLMSKLI